MQTLSIFRRENGYEVDDVSMPGLPATGHGPTIKAAIGDWLVKHQERLGIAFDVSNIREDISRMGDEAEGLI